MTHHKLLEEAMKALEPFADEAQQYDQNDDDKIPDEKDTSWSSDFSVGEIRQARTTYDKIKAALELAPESNDFKISPHTLYDISVNYGISYEYLMIKFGHLLQLKTALCPAKSIGGETQ